jgi:hypothetical protein
MQLQEALLNRRDAMDTEKKARKQALEALTIHRQVFG